MYVWHDEKLFQNACKHQIIQISKKTSGTEF